jgi:hypothetical protein
MEEILISLQWYLRVDADINLLNLSEKYKIYFDEQDETTTKPHAKVLKLKISKFLDLTSFTNLFYLSCIGNKLTLLPELPLKLYKLDCYNNNLIVLPNLPPMLDFLNCGKNNITVLPNLPSKLKVLFCGINNLTFLPELPLSLTSLKCCYNKLTLLPKL